MIENIIEKIKENKIMLGGVLFVALIIIISSIVIATKTSVPTVSGPSGAGSSGPLSNVKARSSQDTSTPMSVLPANTKPWCEDVSYKFTVSGSIAETNLTVPFSLTETFPRIKITNNGIPLADDIVINVTKRVSNKPIVSYTIKKGEAVSGKYSFDMQDVFTDYENSCTKDFVFEPLDIKIHNDNIEYIGRPILYPYSDNKYTVTFFTKSNLSGKPVVLFYESRSAQNGLKNSGLYYKPVFTIKTKQGIDGLRIEREDKVLIKEQYVYNKDNNALFGIVKIDNETYKLVDNKPLEKEIVKPLQLKSQFSNFESSFI